VLIALGANDGLRGLPTDVMQANLLAMVKASKAIGAQVLLIGIRIPPNYGPDYTRAFEQVFKTVAESEKTALLPFLLEPIARDDAAFQTDRLHPTAAAQPALEKHVYAAVLPLISDSNSKSNSRLR
jgi:acyl-CoA thioesterase I